MTTSYIICSPPRLRHLDIQTSQEDIESIIPELRSLLPPAIKGMKAQMAWRGYRDLDEFVIDKTLILELACADLDALLFTQLLTNSSIVGDILLYIIDKEGGNSVGTLLVVDDSQDDVVLSQITREAAIAFIDGFYISQEWHVDGSRLYTVKGHFLELPHKQASARTSFLFTRLAELGMDVRLLLMDWDCRVFYVSGTLVDEVPEERLEEQAEPGSMEELVQNLQKEE